MTYQIVYRALASSLVWRVIGQKTYRTKHSLLFVKKKIFVYHRFKAIIYALNQGYETYMHMQYPYKYDFTSAT